LARGFASSSHLEFAFIEEVVLIILLFYRN